MSALDGSDVLGAAADYHNEKPEYGDFMFPKLFGRIAQIYIENTARPKRNLALVAWKNYAHAKLNHSRKCAMQISLSIPHRKFPIKTPTWRRRLGFRLSQITDGAASVVLVSGRYLNKIGRDKNKAVRLFGYGHTTDYLPLDKKDAPMFRRRAKLRRKLSEWRT